MANLTEILMDSTNGVFSDYNKHVNISNDIGMYIYDISNNNLFSNDSVADFSRASRSIVLPFVMFFFAVSGNVTALVILTIRPSKDSKSTVFYHLVKALVCTDLFCNMTLFPASLTITFKGGIMQTGGMPLCHYYSFILVTGGNANVFTVLVMAAERFIVTKFPFQYSHLVSPRSVNYSIAMIWGLSALIGLLPMVGLGRNTPHWPGTWCFFDYRSKTVGGQTFSYFYAISGLLAITIIIILNIIVAIHVCRMRRHRIRSSSVWSTTVGEPTSTPTRKTAHGNEMRMVCFLMVIILVFSACYVPLMIRVLMNQMFNTHLPVMYGRLDDVIDLWTIRIASLNMIFDPWIYIIGRVTCCKVSGDRDGDSRRQSVRSSFFTHTTLQNGHLNDNLGRPSIQSTPASEDRIFWVTQNATSLFHTRKRDSLETDSVTIPLSSLSKIGPQSITSSVDEFGTQLRQQHSTEKGDFSHGYNT